MGYWNDKDFLKKIVTHMEGFTEVINIGSEYGRNGSEGKGDLWSYLGVADVRIIVLRLFRKSWWRMGGS